MPSINFTSHLARHLSCPKLKVEGKTVREVMDSLFGENPRLKSYILDDQDCLRKHVNIFVDGSQIEDRQKLSDSVAPLSKIYVLQALSGG